MDAYPADFEARYLSGQSLWGEDLGSADLAAWLDDEAEGYADLGYTATTEDVYEFAELSRQTAWRHLPKRQWQHALGVGSATGIEFTPIVGLVDEITIVEPSAQLRAKKIGGIDTTYVDPAADGTLPLQDGAVDLVVCFGVLHHVAQVSRVIAEISRCCKSGAYVLLREPIVSMGDWRKPRAGLTSHERGVPLEIMRAMITDNSFDVHRETFCVFSPVGRLRFLGANGPYSSRVGVALDRVLSAASRPNYRYHATNSWQKVRPSSVAYVLSKR